MSFRSSVAVLVEVVGLERQRYGLRRIHATGDYSVSGLAELFTIGRATVYRDHRSSPAAHYTS